MQANTQENNQVAIATARAHTVHPSAIAGAIDTQHATIRTAPLSSMVRSKLNVRQTGTDISELKALIKAQGLLQNLIGFAQFIGGRETGIIEIVAGGRRLQSLGELIADGDLPVDYAVPYLLVTEDEAIEISLAENSGRADMHPADVCDAMLELTKRGRSPDDIALLFKLDITTVRKWLKLANISPRLVALYRDSQATFEQMQALAITDDHAAQEQAWDSLPQYGRYPRDLRRLLTAQQVSIQSDKLARFVGAQTFEKAGGVIVRDLFSNSDDGYIADVALLEKLAVAKLEKAQAKLTKEGFAWVDILPRATRADLDGYAKVRFTYTDLTPEQQARYEELESLMEPLYDQLDALDEDDEEEIDRVRSECATLEEERRVLHASRSHVAHPEDKALAGAVITVSDYGDLIVIRDVIRASDKSKMVKIGTATDVATPARVKSVHSDRLTHELTSQRTVALQAEMMEQSNIALVYMTYTMMQSVFSLYSPGTLAKIRTSKPSLADGTETSAAAIAFAQRRDDIKARLPSDKVGGGWLEWLAGQSIDVVMDIMAFCVASTLDATQQREGANPDFVTLAQGLKLDMAKWWKPTAANYFAHVSKDRIAAVVTQAVSAEVAGPLEKLKKAAAAELAERVVTDTRWLPEALRTA